MIKIFPVAIVLLSIVYVGALAMSRAAESLAGLPGLAQ